MVKFSVVIPARVGSLRLPRKLLLPVGSKTVLQLTYENCLRSGATNVVVATPDEEILEEVRRWQGNGIRTSPQHHSGSTRVAEAAQLLKLTGFVVNVQGDEPCLPVAHIDGLVQALHLAPLVSIGTLAAPITPDQASSPSAVKVAVSRRRARYFSRAPLGGAMRHIGVYAFRRHALDTLYDLWHAGTDWTPLCAAERLEQMVFLEQELSILVETVPSVPLGIDTQEDYDALCERAACHHTNGDPL